MKTNKPLTSNKTEAPDTQEATVERRRIGKVVHDERGNARLEWVDVTGKPGFDRETLTLKDVPLSIQQEDADTFNPYERKPIDKPLAQRTAKRDLRKLSEWIKATRAAEEKKARGED